MIGAAMDQPGGTLRGSLWALAATALCCLGFAGSASAITVSGVNADPASNQAGANSNLSISFDLSGGSPKDLVIHLPPGLVGNPLATKTCTEAQLKQDACPAASRVGNISNDVQIGGLVPQTANGVIYNVKPRKGEPARFGFVLSAPPADKIVLQSPASLRPSDFGLDTTLRNLPRTATVLGVPVPITITGASLTLQGKVGNPKKGFLRLPTSCGTHTLTVDATPYSGSPGSASDTFDTTGCQSLPFSPEFSADITQRGRLRNAVELSTSIKQTIDEAGLKRATVKLPSELGPNLDRFINSCPPPDFAAGTCPEAARVGVARAESPLQSEALAGPVYVVAGPSPSSLPSLGLDLRGPLSLKLTGNLGIETVPQGIRSSVTFDGLPDIPISDFTLTFDGGPDGLNVASRSPCAKPPFGFDASFLSHAGQAKDLKIAATASCGPPKARVKLIDSGKGKPRLRVGVSAGSDGVRSVVVKAPKGVSFASGRAFKRGASATADDKKLKPKAKGRKLKLKPKGRDGASEVDALLKGGAVIVDGKVRKPFKLTVRDSAGKTTRFSIKAK
jgi:hypothetical protein